MGWDGEANYSEGQRKGGVGLRRRRAWRSDAELCERTGIRMACNHLPPKPLYRFLSSALFTLVLVLIRKLRGY